MLPLENIIIIIDTREQNKKRIEAVESWGLLHGAIIEHRALKHLDYHILGDYKGYDINIGIEAKALSQFCSDDYELNKEKLFAACGVYDEVALFIETGNYEFKSMGFGDASISCRIKNDLTITGKLSIFEGACSTLGRYGIHVRQLRSEAHFPYAIENLITYSIHEHDLIKAPDFMTQYKSTLLTFLTPLQTRKILNAYPNMFWLCSASEESYKQIIGNKSGKKLYDFIRNPLLVTPEWSNSHFPDGNNIEEREYDTNDVIKAVTDYLSGFPEGRIADEICTHFNLLLGDSDKEKMLECLKKMAYKGIITNTVAGLFHIPKNDNLCDKKCDEANAYECKGDICKQHPDYKSQSSSVNISESKSSVPSSHLHNKENINTHDTLSSQCDPAEREGTILNRCHLITHPSPADDNHQNSLNSSQKSDPAGLFSKDLVPSVPSTPCIPADDNNKIDSAVPSYSAPLQGMPIQSPVLSESKKSNMQEQDLIIAPKPLSSVPATPDIELFGKTNPDWKVELNKMSLKEQLKIWFSDSLPHTLQETVDAHSQFNNGRVFDMVMGGLKAGYLKREIIPAKDGNPSKVIFQRVIK